MVDILEALDECAGYEPQGRELRALQPHLQIVLGHQQRHSALVMIGECDLLPIRADLSRLQTLHHVFKQREHCWCALIQDQVQLKVFNGFVRDALILSKESHREGEGQSHACDGGPLQTALGLGSNLGVSRGDGELGADGCRGHRRVEVELHDGGRCGFAEV